MMSFNLSFGIYFHDIGSGYKIRRGLGVLLDKTATGDGKKDLHDIGSASMEYENTKYGALLGEKCDLGWREYFRFKFFNFFFVEFLYMLVLCT